MLGTAGQTIPMFLKEEGFFSTEVFTFSDFHRVFKDDDPMMF